MVFLREAYLGIGGSSSVQQPGKIFSPTDSLIFIIQGHGLSRLLGGSPRWLSGRFGMDGLQAGYLCPEVVSWK